MRCHKSRTLDLKGVMDDTLQQEHSRCTGDVETSILALTDDTARQRNTNHPDEIVDVPVQQKHLNAWVGSKLLCSVFFTSALVDPYARDG